MTATKTGCSQRQARETHLDLEEEINLSRLYPVNDVNGSIYVFNLNQIIDYPHNTPVQKIILVDENAKPSWMGVPVSQAETDLLRHFIKLYVIEVHRI